MGTHPIFESDFDCLTDKMGSIYVRDGGLASTLFPLDKVFVIFRGRKVNEFTLLPAGSFVSITAKMFGGKGGYGQLLKDFGKETQLSGNKKSMRDLSGRIIRDLDDMEDFKKWLDTREERKKKKEQEKMDGLQRALIEPKHLMDNSKHFQDKETIAANQTSALAMAHKRKLEITEAEITKTEKKKKKKWYEMDSDEDKPN